MATLPDASKNRYKADEIHYPSDTWRIEGKRIGELYTGLEVVSQAIEIILHTERFQYQVCSTDFGVELQDLIGKEPDYVESMLRRRIPEALKGDERIISVDNFIFTHHTGHIICQFSVKTVFGDVRQEVSV